MQMGDGYQSSLDVDVRFMKGFFSFYQVSCQRYWYQSLSGFEGFFGFVRPCDRIIGMTGSMVRGGSRSGVSEMRGWVRVSKGVSSIIGYHGIIVISYLLSYMGFFKK